jgi:hypothetical protein
MIRRNADGSVTVGIIPEEDKGAVNPAPSSEEKPVAKKTRKPRKTTTTE